MPVNIAENLPRPCLQTTSWLCGGTGKKPAGESEQCVAEYASQGRLLSPGRTPADFGGVAKPRRRYCWTDNQLAFTGDQVWEGDGS